MKSSLLNPSQNNMCGGLEMAPHENRWSPLDGAH